MRAPWIGLREIEPVAPWSARPLQVATLLAIALMLVLGGRRGSVFAAPAAQAQTPAAQLAGLAQQVDAARERVVAGDAVGAQSAYKAFDAGWYDIEDGIREQSRPNYRAIEDAMAVARGALEARPFDAQRARAALERLRGECDAFIAGKPPLPASTGAAGAAPNTSTTNASTGPVTLPSLLAHLDRSGARLDAGDAAGAAAEVDAFRRDWTEVEGQVKTKSTQVYRDTENNMALAYAQLTQRPADVAGARTTLAQLKSDLAPYAAQPARYGLFDAAIILLREGLEALLVVGALLAFLAKTGNASKGRWIWAGSGVGILASVVVAVTINLAFSRAAAGANRELLEGVTGLVAAAMLIYVSYWLHSKASLGAWQRYVRDTTSAALARNSLLGLALIAFLAVFREGAETALFYLGIAPSIALRDLVLGLALGAAGLAVLGVAMLVFGVRLPIRPFFLGTSVLVYYLAFKFIGTGIHALQVAGVLSATPSRLLPENGVLGLFPTWETTAVQAGLALLAAAVLLAHRSGRARLVRAAPAVMALLSLVLAACGAPQTAQVAPANAPVGGPTTVTTSTATRKEVALVSAVRPILVNTLDAVKRNDVVAARTAFAAYDPAWNGIEVYVNFRSRSLYEELEQTYQGKIEQSLDAPQPSVAELRPLVEAMLAKYDEAIKLSQTGPAISPLFDDVAAIRIARAPLRTASGALKAGDVTGAKKAYAGFQQALPGVKDVLRLRSPDAYTELEETVAKATAAFAQDKPAADLAPPLDALTERYNYALSLVNAAARNADLAKGTYTPDDVRQTLLLATMEAHLRASLPLWESGDYGAAGAQAGRAAGDRFDAAAAPLKARGADAALKRALDGYATLAGAPGEAAKVRIAYKSAVEAVWLAEQTLVGQFWSDAKLHGAVVRGLAASLREEYGAGPITPAGPVSGGYATAWGMLNVAERRYQQRVESSLKTTAAAQAETIARQFQTLRAALPDAVRAPTTPLPPEAIGAATATIGAALESSLGLVKP